MKRLVILLVVALAAGFLSCAWYFRQRIAADAPRDELSWLKKEFALDARQFAEIERLHHTYRPICDTHCTEYLQAHRRLTALLERSPAYTPATDEALEAIFRIQTACQRDMLRHGYEVAAVMSPEQGGRYLEMIRGRVLAVGPEEMRRHTR